MVIGFIGAGNMGRALMQGMISGGASAGSFIAYDIDAHAIECAAGLGVRTTGTLQTLADSADVLVLAVKPKFCQSVLDSLRACGYSKNLLSIAVGWSQKMLQDALPGACVARAMPNTPTQVRQGVIAMNENHTFPGSVFEALGRQLGACGRIVVVPESLFDAVTAVSGSGPAYVYLFIEALADAGVRQGLARDMAYTLAAQTLAGAAAMVLETGEHPGRLKDNVSSPGGTTIEAVYALEKAGLRGAVMDAVDACARKAKKMLKNSEESVR